MAAPHPEKRATKVAIVGGGISGLVCALGLSKVQELEVDLYEAAPQLAERGAGLTLWGRSWNTLKSLGLEESLQGLLAHPRSDTPALAFQFRKGDQAKGFGFYDLIINGGPIHFHRADFQQILLAHISDRVKARFHLGRRLASYTEYGTYDSGRADSARTKDPRSVTGPVELLFTDGSTASCDVLIGADGIRSVVRRILLTDHAQYVEKRQNDQAKLISSLTHSTPPTYSPPIFTTPTAEGEGEGERPSDYLASIEPIWSGWVAYRGLVPSEKLRARMPGHRTLNIPTQYWGKHKYLVVYPIAQGRLINVVVPIRLSPTEAPALPWPWVTTTGKGLGATSSSEVKANALTEKEPHKHVGDAAKEEILSHYSTWDAESRALLECLESPSCWAIHALHPLKTYISRSGRVALLGDAAHAMTPHQGAGAGQAIEDAYILSSLLASPLCNSFTIPEILDVYNTICQPFGNRVQAATKAQGAYHDLSGPGFEDVKEGDDHLTAETLHEKMEGIVKEWEWQWSTTAEPHRNKAWALLRSKLGM